MKNFIDYSINIVSNTEYSNPSRYISGRIIEYDMKAANISCLLENNCITAEYYNYLNSMPKREREIQVGMDRIMHPEFSTIINKTIKAAKIELVKANDINPSSIVRVANDAVYINTPVDLNITKFGNYLEFRPKGVYSVFIKLNRVIIFLNLLENNSVDIDIKGIGKNMELHSNGILSAIATTVMLTERDSIDSGLNYISSIIEEYVNLRLPMDFYREFNAESCYRLLQADKYSKVNILGLRYLDESYKDKIDIQYNLSVLREFWSILVELHNIRS